jgi:N-succinyldiaminopimelate aminotransferase
MKASLFSQQCLKIWRLEADITVAVNPRLELLHPYPFEKLRFLHEGVIPTSGLKPINLGIGEPQHPTPKVITEALTSNLHLLGKYPPTGGSQELREAISNWIGRRYGIPTPDPVKEVLPVAGTREALFGFAQAILDPSDPGVVLLPNPFYQIYEGAAIMAGAEPFYVPTPAEKGFLPDWSAVPESVWPRVKLAYVCSPGNPAGAVFGTKDWQEIFELGDKFGFIIAADECYSEIYNGPAPTGALEAAAKLGRSSERLVSFNSLSKRSSAPGLRSGFVTGDPAIIESFLLYRTYHGAAPSSLTQAASVPAWNDEVHVEENRSKYRAKFEAARKIFPEIEIPAGGFFLWLPVDDDEQLSKNALQQGALTILPGRYLARETNGVNPGLGYVRIALVAELDVCTEALERLSKIS